MEIDGTIESLYFKLTKEINFDARNRELTMSVCKDVNDSLTNVRLSECKALSCSVLGFIPYDFEDETDTINTGYQFWQSFEDVGVVNTAEYDAKIEVFHSLQKIHSVNYNCFLNLDWTTMYGFFSRLVLDEFEYDKELSYSKSSNLHISRKCFHSNTSLSRLNECLNKLSAKDVLTLNISILQCRLNLICNNGEIDTNIMIEQLYNFTFIDLVGEDIESEKSCKIEEIFVCNHDQITSFVYKTLKNGEIPDFAIGSDIFSSPSVGATVCIRTTHEVLFISAGMIIIDKQAFDITNLSEGNYDRRHYSDYPKSFKSYN